MHEPYPREWNQAYNPAAFHSFRDPACLKSTFQNRQNEAVSFARSAHYVTGQTLCSSLEKIEPIGLRLFCVLHWEILSLQLLRP